MSLRYLVPIYLVLVFGLRELVLSYINERWDSVVEVNGPRLLQGVSNV